MTPPPPQLLPLANTSAFTPRGRAGRADTPAWSQAWSRATQLRAGEQDEGATDASRAPLQAVPCTPAGETPRSASFAGRWSESTASEVAAGMGTPGETTARHAAARGIAPAGCFIPSGPGPSTDPPSAEQLTDPPPAHAAAKRIQLPASTPRAPVRVHVDRQEDGCVVWLGVDAGAERLAQHIVSELAPGRPGVLPVLAVVCNGMPVYTRPRIPKENP